MMGFKDTIYHNLRIIYRIGCHSYFKYLLARPGSLLKLTINNEPVYVRKGTTDLLVAIGCLFGEFEVLRYLLPADYTGNILDAGGYIGTSVIALRRLFPKAHIIVIEPSTDNLNILKKNLENFDNIEIIQGALVGSDFKSVDLKNRRTGEWGFSIVEDPKDATGAKTLQQTKAYRLRDLVKEGEQIGLLKLDIEGGEVDLVKNDMQSLQNIYIVFAELHDRIIDGCTDLFLKFSENRILIKDKHEKFLSIKK